LRYEHFTLMILISMSSNTCFMLTDLFACLFIISKLQTIDRFCLNESMMMYLGSWQIVLFTNSLTISTDSCTYRLQYFTKLGYLAVSVKFNLNYIFHLNFFPISPWCNAVKQQNVIVRVKTIEEAHTITCLSYKNYRRSQMLCYDVILW
jgi:hypothetical protein